MKCITRDLKFDETHTKTYFIHTEKYLLEIREDGDILFLHRSSLNPFGIEMDVPFKIMKKIIICFFEGKTNNKDFLTL